MRVCSTIALFLTAAMAPTSLLATAVKLPAALTSNKLPHQLIHPGDIFYPEALAKKGLQGEVTLEIQLSAAGQAKTVKVKNASSSPELDKNALAYVNTGYWKLPENDLKYNQGAYTLNIIFLRDSVLSINKKSCADFNIDLKYFRSVHANQSTKNFGALELVANISTVQLMKTQGASGALKFVNSVDAINSDTINACAKKPAELFVKAYAKATKKHGVKF